MVLPKDLNAWPSALSITAALHILKPNTEQKQVGGCFLCCVQRTALSFEWSRKTMKKSFPERNTMSQVQYAISSLQQHSYRLEEAQRLGGQDGLELANYMEVEVFRRHMTQEFCREKQERKIMQNKIMLGRWIGRTGQRGTHPESIL